MIGFSSRTTSPSSVTSSRSTPWVAGWWGPMLSVNSSVVSPPRWAAICSSSGESVIDSSSVAVARAGAHRVHPGLVASLWVNSTGSPPIGKSRRCGWPS